MPDSAHSYSRADRAALILFSSGKCYWPSCSEPLLVQVEGKHRIALEVAHIRAAKPGGQRYVLDMSDEDRKSFDNLIFLCVPHHKTVDESGADAQYSIEILEQWKAAREQGASESLRGLRNVTESKLVQMISAAYQERDDDVKQTLERLEKTDAEAAALLRELRDELNSMLHNGSILNPDAVDMLSHAAAGLVGLEDHAAMLYHAAEDLRGLDDRIAMLNDVGTRLNVLDHYAGLLNEAVANIHGLEGYIDQLNQVAAKIDRAAGRVEHLGEVLD